jgi:hypothetical protein
VNFCDNLANWSSNCSHSESSNWRVHRSPHWYFLPPSPAFCEVSFFVSVSRRPPAQASITSVSMCASPTVPATWLSRHRWSATVHNGDLCLLCISSGFFRVIPRIIVCSLCLERRDTPSLVLIGGYRRTQVCDFDCISFIIGTLVGIGVIF